MSAFDQPTIVVFREGIVRVLPTSTYGLQCVARTTKGKRCKHAVEGGQQGRWRELHSQRGELVIYDVAHLPRETMRRWLDQHCEVHDIPETVDHDMPEWEALDLEGIHAKLVRPLPADWVW